MYFVIRYNYSESLTSKSVVGFFSELCDAKELVMNMTNDPNRNIVVIAHFNEGTAYYTRPEEVYRWNDYYQCYIPVVLDDIGRRLLIIY